MVNHLFDFDKILLLGTRSPRRRELIERMDIPYRTIEIPFDESRAGAGTPLEMARAKMDAYKGELSSHEILLTADTMVFAGNRRLEKPRDTRQAMEMLESLSGRSHRVVTGVCMKDALRQTCFDDTAYVYFRELSREEMCYYIRQYMPLDKAGAYGIQEWIGLTGITRLEGNFYTVMGLPAAKVWEEWLRFNGY